MSQEDDALRQVCLFHTYIKEGNAVLTVWAKQKLKASLWFSIGKIVDEETLRLNTNATPQFIGALTEMVWSQIGMPLSISRRIPNADVDI